MDGLMDKVVILTGASEGIGRALARSLARLGCRLVLSARNEARLRTLQLELGSAADVLLVATDVADETQCRSLVDACIDKYGRLDILINNAGMTMWSRFDELEDLQVLEQIMQVNYLGPARLTHYALPHLKQSHGQVVAIASVAGLTGVPTRSGYAASKHAMMGFFDSLRIELADDDVAVTVICPDFVVSQIHKRALDGKGNPLGTTPMKEDKIMSAEACAEAMIPAIACRERMLIMSRRGRLGRWVRLLWPSAIDRIAKKAIAGGH
ncbi:SDR family oxidoreductase [Shewanella sp. 3B26]|jgi:short-subunit dehydrogenase|uniref:SDR family oxidoreductase n=1 Tax=Shewanella zhuhaiensis TaxID=2919576 RepID=A0AAJ1EYY4_9GAMM|nr:SDR family oxidoreductase [Shewanella zhuhaiensis]MCH4292713.1 SDR family oxidoreductase [Shewanella zhuhaiensis]